jgi:hypothetical protein
MSLVGTCNHCGEGIYRGQEEHVCEIKSLRAENARLHDKVIAAQSKERLAESPLFCIEECPRHKALREEIARLRTAIEAARVMRYYCLGSDASTENMLHEFDVAMAALSTLPEGGQK